MEKLDLLKQAVGDKSSLRYALPSVKTAVLIDSTEDDIEAGKLLQSKSFPNRIFLGTISAKGFGHVISWDDLKTLGSTQSNSQLVQRESCQQVNRACMVLFTSGTTGLPKGKITKRSQAGTYFHFVMCLCGKQVL